MTFVDQTKVPTLEELSDLAAPSMKDREDRPDQYEHNLLLTVQACWRLQQEIEALKASVDQLFT